MTDQDRIEITTAIIDRLGKTPDGVLVEEVVAAFESGEMPRKDGLATIDTALFRVCQDRALNNIGITYNREANTVSGAARDTNEWARLCERIDHILGVSIDRPASATVVQSGSVKTFTLTLPPRR